MKNELKEYHIDVLKKLALRKIVYTKYQIAKFLQRRGFLQIVGKKFIYKKVKVALIRPIGLSAYFTVLKEQSLFPQGGGKLANSRRR